MEEFMSNSTYTDFLKEFEENYGIMEEDFFSKDTDLLAELELVTLSK